MGKVTLTFQLPSISVEVEAKEGMDNQQLLELGQNALAKQIGQQLPRGFKWGKTEGNVIADEDVLCGRPVKFKSDGKVGIIYEIKPGTKYPIRVLVNGTQDMQCTQAALEKVSKKTSIDKLITGRLDYEKTLNEWLAPRTAYFVNGNEIIPVIVVPARTKLKAYIVGHEVKGSFYTLASSNTSRLFDNIEDAKNYLSKINK